ncbi:hypothetical protein C8R46DRAFT_1030312 [Mycena filopes]|nr:hypothetical protein C8R46DRAFT_1030312 [Mycena filopes]
MPQLTHLSFVDNKFLALCPRILETCPGLRVLISLGILTAPINAPDHGDYDDVLAELAQDKRFVAMMDKEAHLGDWIAREARLGDWIAGARGQGDYWERAEQFIAKRSRARLMYELMEEGVAYYTLGLWRFDPREYVLWLLECPELGLAVSGYGWRDEESAG